MEAVMRTIFHVDVNSAFLSWTAIKQLEDNPGSTDLRTVPSAVGGDVETRHGIITAKSIPAKRYGIQTGEPVVKALAKCPDLILVKSDFVTYRKYSSLMMALLRTYTPYVEQASIDEAYLDVSGITASFNGDVPALARDIADRIKNDLGFTVNVGISTNKFLAKMASDFSKPDKVHTLYPDEIQEKLWPLPIGQLHGCGSATAKKLQNIGIYTIRDAAGTDLLILQNILGSKAGAYIHERANGRDHSEVAYQEREAKSYSNETTTAEDIDKNNYERLAVPILKELSSKVSARLQKDHVRGATVSVAVKTGNFQRHSRQAALNTSTDSKDELFSQAKILMHNLLFGSDGLFRKGEVIRLIGVGISNLEHGENQQMTLLEWMQLNERQTRQKEKNDKLDRMLEMVQKKYGADALKKGNF
ncbi:MAG: DNA polymerase IV [Blautia sp.]|nr:DNA polymerase IV [Blautia sp.]